MRIVYDDIKRARNRETHGGLDFADLDAEFFAGSIVVPAKKERFMAIGPFRGDMIAVVFARLGSEGISVVSMRPASAKERKSP
ncbi:MAG: BrnT family toxin [Rhizobiaceae bacterium]|nr:BrnT family toxin [Rhizobiaceae bacterium]